jgi:hypothetical protein
VSCNTNDGYRFYEWRFNHSKLEYHQGYLKSNDIINLSIQKGDGNFVTLRSHDIQFTIGSDTFQEVVCHNERLGGNDEVSNFIYLFTPLKFCGNIKFFFPSLL